MSFSLLLTCPLMLPVLPGIQGLFSPCSATSGILTTLLFLILLLFLRSIALIYFSLWGCQQFYAKLMIDLGTASGLPSSTTRNMQGTFSPKLLLTNLQGMPHYFSSPYLCTCYSLDQANPPKSPSPSSTTTPPSSRQTLSHYCFNKTEPQNEAGFQASQLGFASLFHHLAVA